MGFQIQSLPVEEFSPLFNLDDDALSARLAKRYIVTEKPGTPCRVSLEDAEVGETVILLNYEHLKNKSPFRASHAIFVREKARQAFPGENEIPDLLRTRLISVRAFDADHFMIDADVLEGTQLNDSIASMFETEKVAYLHLHNAKLGCYLANVVRT